jgi:translation initiation factor IF-3
MRAYYSTARRRFKISRSVRINNEIRSEQLRVIDSDGTQLGIITRQEAMNIALAQDLDLVEISPESNPPVAKIVNWGKYQYQKLKEQQKIKRNSKAVELKQMRMGLKIGSNDLDIKLRKVREFLKDGHKVKITVVYRGREMAHQELGFTMLKKVMELLEQDAVQEQPPQMAGRNLSILIRSK